MSLQHLDHPARACCVEGMASGFAATSSSRISSIRRATCGCSKSVAGPATRSEARRRDRGFADMRLGKSRGRAARTLPASSPTAWASIGSRWPSARRSPAGSPWRRQIAIMGEAIGAPQHRGVRADGSGGPRAARAGRPPRCSSLLPAGDAWHEIPSRRGRVRPAGCARRPGPGTGKGASTRARGGGAAVRPSIWRAFEYRPVQKPRLDAYAAASRGGLQALVSTDDRYGEYAKAVLTKLLELWRARWCRRW